jgi:hypothetical protein
MDSEQAGWLTQKAGLHDKRIGHGTPENGHRAKTATSLFTRLHDNIL